TTEAFGTSTTYSEIVKSVQHRLEFLSRAGISDLFIHQLSDIHNRIRVELAGRVCSLQAAPGFIYTLVAESKKSGGVGVVPDQVTGDDVKRVYRRLTGGNYSDALAGTDLNFIFEWVDELNRARPSLIEGFRKNFQVN